MGWRDDFGRYNYIHKASGVVQDSRTTKVRISILRTSKESGAKLGNI
jgi:hypothetical protein